VHVKIVQAVCVNNLCTVGNGGRAIFNINIHCIKKTSGYNLSNSMTKLLTNRPITLC
jgi:hypothetical protein